MISIEIFTIFLFVSFFYFSEVHFNIMHVLSRLVYWFSFLLLMAFLYFKLVSSVMSARLRMQCIRAPPTLVCRPVRRLYLSGKRRMVILFEPTILRRLTKTPDKICVLRDVRLPRTRSQRPVRVRLTQ